MFRFLVLVCLFSASSLRAETLILAGGCFWCVEADFDTVPGVTSVTAGFSGGSEKNPKYKDVSKAKTSHREVVLIDFDPTQITARHLMDLFLRSIDPFDDEGQFCDRGDSYRSAIFWNNERQQLDALAAVAMAEADLGQPIVTEIIEAGPFYEASGRHQDYYKTPIQVLTRFGLIDQREAYKRYRKACGRDARVFEVWGHAASFVK